MTYRVFGRRWRLRRWSRCPSLTRWCCETATCGCWSLRPPALPPSGSCCLTAALCRRPRRRKRSEQLGAVLGVLTARAQPATIFPLVWSRPLRCCTEQRRTVDNDDGNIGGDYADSADVDCRSDFGRATKADQRYSKEARRLDRAARRARHQEQRNGRAAERTGMRVRQCVFYFVRCIRG